MPPRLSHASQPAVAHLTASSPLDLSLPYTRISSLHAGTSPSTRPLNAGDQTIPDQASAVRSRLICAPNGRPIRPSSSPLILSIPSSLLLASECRRHRCRSLMKMKWPLTKSGYVAYNSPLGVGPFPEPCVNAGCLYTGLFDEDEAEALRPLPWYPENFTGIRIFHVNS